MKQKASEHLRVLKSQQTHSNMAWINQNKSIHCGSKVYNNPIVKWRKIESYVNQAKLVTTLDMLGWGAGYRVTMAKMVA